MTRRINMIIVHCSATPPDMDIGVEKIREWHKERGWSDVGYHCIIRRNGNIENGRHVNRAGAHTTGHNANSIGVCLIGGINKKGKAEANYTPAQWATLERLLRVLRVEYRDATIHGHREFAAKDCPSFDIQAWVKERNI